MKINIIKFMIEFNYVVIIMTNHIYIIFDLDETLGQFVQLGHFYNGITQYFKKIPTKKEFFNLLDNYEKYFRPNIFTILNYIKKYKIKYKHKLKTLIFTNNQVGISWITKIKDYIEYKIHYKLFDKVIGPYKIKSEIQEIMRSNHIKKYDDLIKFIKCDETTPIMFLDDNFHNEMVRDNIVYLLLKPYEFQYKLEELIPIYLKNNNVKNKTDFICFITNFMKKQKYNITKSIISHEDYSMSDIIMKYIHEFLNKHLQMKSNLHKTLKKRKYYVNKTIKKRNYKI